MIRRPLPTSVHSNTLNNSLWKAKRTGDYGNYIKDRCFQKFLLKADYLMPCIIA